MRLFLRMTGMIMAWSIVAGLIIGADIGLFYVAHFTKVCTPFGALLALIAVVVALAFGEVRNHRRFKLTIAVCTSALPACVTLIMVWLALAFHPIGVDDVVMLLAVVSLFPCVIFFSQLAARHYLREISPRKRKQKPA